MAQNQNSILEHILINYRWVFVCLFLLPASFLFDLVMHIRSWIVFKTRSAPKQHDGKVKNVQRQVREWMRSGKGRRMCTARPGWQTISFRTPKYKSELFQVDVNLVDILEVDVDRKVVRVEPMVTMGALTARLNPLGWTIPVLPEIDDLTVGGLVMGTGIESTSHKHGLFQHICVSYELVLADGSLVTCSKESSPELFYSIPWSYGTLGFLTAVELKMIPAKKYVRLTYRPITDFEQFAQEFELAASDNNNEFVEGILFGINEGVLMTGNLADIAEHNKVNAIGKWHKPWFFVHVKNMLQQESPVTEYIPLRDYYHRHTRSIFWELQDIIPFGNNPIFRYLLGWTVPPKISLLKLTQTEATKRLYETKHVIQDMLVPIGHMRRCIGAFHENFNRNFKESAGVWAINPGQPYVRSVINIRHYRSGRFLLLVVADDFRITKHEDCVQVDDNSHPDVVYPLWLCPFSLASAPGFVHPASPRQELYVDIGVYGVPKAEKFEARESVRAIEKLVIECKGFQMLYADTFTSRQEFRQMFDHTLYDKLRDELDCKEAFPEVYDKVCRKARS